MAKKIEILENTLLKLLVRRGTDTDRRNISLSEGELGYTTDTERLFIGNGQPGGVVAGNRYLGSDSDPSATFTTALTGDLVFDTNTKSLCAFKGSGVWERVSSLTESTGDINVSVDAGDILSNACGRNLSIDTNGRIQTDTEVVFNKIGTAGWAYLNIPRKVRFYDGSSSEAFTFPTNALGGKYLRTDASGVLTWEDPVGAAEFFYNSENGPIPVGAVLPFTAGGVIPTGYIVCNGQEVSQTTYSDLFNVIGTNYGTTNPGASFKVPDYSLSTLYGVDSDPHNAQVYKVGADVNLGGGGYTPESGIVARMWHNSNSSLQVEEGFNAAVRLSAGVFQYTFTTPRPNNRYTVLATRDFYHPLEGDVVVRNRTTTGFILHSSNDNSSAQDPDGINVTVIDKLNLSGGGGSGGGGTSGPAALVNFDGGASGTSNTGPQTIRSSNNIASVVKTGNGQYTVTFITPMSDANYIIAGSGQFSIDTGRGVAIDIDPDTQPTTTSCKIRAISIDTSPGPNSSELITVAFFDVNASGGGGISTTQSPLSAQGTIYVIKAIPDIVANPTITVVSPLTATVDGVNKTNTAFSPLVGDIVIGQPDAAEAVPPGVEVFDTAGTGTFTTVTRYTKFYVTGSGATGGRVNGGAAATVIGYLDLPIGTVVNVDVGAGIPQSTKNVDGDKSRIIVNGDVLAKSKGAICPIYEGAAPYTAPFFNDGTLLLSDSRVSSGYIVKGARGGTDTNGDGTEESEGTASFWGGCPAPGAGSMGHQNLTQQSTGDGIVMFEWVDDTVSGGGGGGGGLIDPNHAGGTINVTTSFQDLDLSSIVGSNKAQVTMEVYGGSTGVGTLFRTKGSVIERFAIGTSAGWGSSGVTPGPTDQGGVVTLTTDSNGEVQFNGAGTSTGVNYKVLTYQVIS